ncbi:Hypothetical protein SMAX5B_008490 [Scophthalmus maximus]|uniref:Uncharacterized protein n=1 Tax=Scophthalmus maximus TaxID=52904 RepID=A0A2U9CEL2_SCOMX|nr:Hypothetical protein SMAX5B_008490 [Scophthalmus maximus]KAF0027688.1 hypothetical protein F2P81_020429 [Scophthalmus maximus]
MERSRRYNRAQKKSRPAQGACHSRILKRGGTIQQPGRRVEEAGDGAAGKPARTQPLNGSLTLSEQILPQPVDKPITGADMPDRADPTMPEPPLQRTVGEKEQEIGVERRVLLIEETKIAGLLSGSEGMHRTAAQ